jgi:hypothetical protein
MSSKGKRDVVVGKKMSMDASREEKRRDSANGQIEGKNVWVLPPSVAGIHRTEPYMMLFLFLGRQIRPGLRQDLRHALQT